MIEHTSASTSATSREQALLRAGARAARIPRPRRVRRVERAGFGQEDKPVFWVAQREPLGTGTHVAFTSPDRATVDRFHAVALEAGRLETTAPRAGCGSTTTRRTTRPSCSTRTATTSRPSATAPNSRSHARSAGSLPAHRRFTGIVDTMRVREPDGQQLQRQRRAGGSSSSTTSRRSSTRSRPRSATRATRSTRRRTAASARRRDANEPDLIVLDWMLPDLDGHRGRPAAPRAAASRPRSSS